MYEDDTHPQTKTYLLHYNVKDAQRDVRFAAI